MNFFLTEGVRRVAGVKKKFQTALISNSLWGNRTTTWAYFVTFSSETIIMKITHSVLWAKALEKYKVTFYLFSKRRGITASASDRAAKSIVKKTRLKNRFSMKLYPSGIGAKKQVWRYFSNYYYVVLLTYLSSKYVQFSLFNYSFQLEAMYR